MSRLTRAQRIIGVYPNPVCGTDTLTQGGHVTWHAIPGVPGTVYSQGTNTWRDEVPSPEHGSPVVAPTALSSAPSYAYAQNYALSTEDLTSSAVETSTAATNDPAAASASSAAHKLASAAHDPIIDSDDEEEDVEELVVPPPGQSSAAPTANDDGNEEELRPPQTAATRRASKH
ncbi:unnamed protein product [Tilletia controversa]|nr:hypothetical protein CF328_g9474 [Tilletia controversa]CAD6986360.1 unnamed protein product [Tilletia controversa]